jgi:hypothetical protein
LTAPLRLVEMVHGPENERLQFLFDRPVTPTEAEQFASLPPAPRIAAELGEQVRRAMLAEIVARMCRVYVLAAIALPDGPKVVAWLKDYIDGKDGHGPIGGPMAWPQFLPSAQRLLTEWGFERSPNGWVVRAGTTKAPEGVTPS